MEKEINIAELLKNYPKGTKLYSPIVGEVEFLEVTNFFEYEEGKILVKQVNYDSYLLFSSTGHFDPYLGDNDGEVMLFPSKENRSWENFGKDKKGKTESKDILGNGFKIGDVVRKPEGHIGCVTDVSKDDHVITVNDYRGLILRYVDRQLTFATDDEIDEWNHGIHLRGWHYSKSKKRVVYWFTPFTRVLVRNKRYETWHCNLFSHYEKTPDNLYPYCCAGGGRFSYCIPYNEKTAHLVNTRDDYGEDEK